MYFKFDTVRGNGGDHSVRFGDQHINVMLRFNYLGAFARENGEIVKGVASRCGRIKLRQRERVVKKVLC